MILFIGNHKNITMGSKGRSASLHAPEPKRYVSLPKPLSF